eukprot:gnl/Spiro4/26473_TR13170_c0_g2_i1.p1 gnl/Spiro4/26473_TR13170_c0_g2~~gnl/Spiro4/26473_TR13170_c0_g2_i1.p1  ORF type:complete len:732 (+),score=108.31 gnl/Spiro4/26473_TR13170_c0_g2_i1:110-2197(+)
MTWTDNDKVFAQFRSNSVELPYASNETRLKDFKSSFKEGDLFDIKDDVLRKVADLLYVAEVVANQDFTFEGWKGWDSIPEGWLIKTDDYFGFDEDLFPKGESNSEFYSRVKKYLEPETEDEDEPPIFFETDGEEDQDKLRYVITYLELEKNRWKGLPESFQMLIDYHRARTVAMDYCLKMISNPIPWQGDAVNGDLQNIVQVCTSNGQTTTQLPTADGTGPPGEKYPASHTTKTDSLAFEYYFADADKDKGMVTIWHTTWSATAQQCEPKPAESDPKKLVKLFNLQRNKTYKNWEDVPMMSQVAFQMQMLGVKEGLISLYDVESSSGKDRCVLLQSVTDSRKDTVKTYKTTNTVSSVTFKGYVSAADRLTLLMKFCTNCRSRLLKGQSDEQRKQQLQVWANQLFLLPDKFLWPEFGEHRTKLANWIRNVDEDESLSKKEKAAMQFKVPTKFLKGIPRAAATYLRAILDLEENRWTLRATDAPLAETILGALRDGVRKSHSLNYCLQYDDSIKPWDNDALAERTDFWGSKGSSLNLIQVCGDKLNPHDSLDRIAFHAQLALSEGQGKAGTEQPVAQFSYLAYRNTKRPDYFRFHFYSVDKDADKQTITVQRNVWESNREDCTVVKANLDSKSLEKAFLKLPQDDQTKLLKAAKSETFNFHVAMVLGEQLQAAAWFDGRFGVYARSNNQCLLVKKYF